jgi:uncharacterized membrane protein YqhA
MADFKASSLIGILLKIIAVVAVVASIVLAIGVEYFAVAQTIKNLDKIAGGTSAEDDIVKEVIKTLDLVLLGVIFFTIAAALFELFVAEIDNLPDWLVIKNLDDLKTMMIKMVIVVMAISFTGKIITWRGETEILYYGVGLAAVIGALSYFLLVKERSKEEK